MILYSSDKKDKTTTRSTIRHAANKVDETGKKDKPDRQEKTKTMNKVDTVDKVGKTYPR